MKRAKILSLVLTAVLLCGCVFGALVFGTSAEEAAGQTLEVTADGTYKTIEEALTAAEGMTWAEGAELLIQVEVEEVAASISEAGVLFSQKTIWRTDNTKLPITIQGQGKTATKITFGAKKMACANDYAFENLTLPVGADCVF